jgi:hypothetical protein
VFSGLVATDWARVGVNWHNQPELADAELVSGNYFDVLGVQAAVGRLFVPSDDLAQEASPVVVLSFGYWQRRFDSDPQVVNQSISINGHPFTIIGVAQPGFQSVAGGDNPSIFAPMMMRPEITPGSNDLEKRRSRWLRAGFESYSAAEVSSPAIHTPLPVSEMVWGEPAPLSATLTEATNDPVAVGLKTIEIEQFAPGASELPQLLVWLNDPAFVPVMVIPEMVSGLVPGFWTATIVALLAVPTDCAGKVMLDEENDTSGVSGEIVNLTGREVPPPGGGLVTVIDAVPAFVTSADGITVVSIVLATKMVGKGTPFQLMTAPSANFCPSNVS